MRRRDFLRGAAGAVATGRSLLAATTASRARLGLCSFSCHQQWKAVQNNEADVQFQDALGFYRYGRSLGAEGVQTSLRSRDPQVARAIREAVERDDGYFEAELKLPKTEADVEGFAEDVKLAKAAGATVGRAVCMGGRRYEVFKSRDEFDAFAVQSRKSLQLAEPVVRRERLKLAIENHKDFTIDELIPLILQISSEWVGVLVDTGNNIALLESPERTAERLAPWALSVHLKDMAVQPWDEGFLLSEVPLGTGALDLKRIITALVRQNPRIVLNLEMATRDPLKIPCRRDDYFVTFPDQRKAVEPMLSWVQAHPLRRQPPATSGKPAAQIVRDEEENNRRSLEWMATNA